MTQRFDILKPLFLHGKENASMKWFTDVRTVEDLRKQYRKLLKKYHPDNSGGSVEATQEINREYDELFAILSKQQNADQQGKAYSEEENARFKEILQKIIGFNIEIEIIGSWIWCFDCYGYKDQLKTLGFTWASKKKAWVWHEDPWRKHHKSEIPLDAIREKYGTQKLRKRSMQTVIDD